MYRYGVFSFDSPWDNFLVSVYAKFCAVAMKQLSFLLYMYNVFLGNSAYFIFS